MHGPAINAGRLARVRYIRPVRAFFFFYAFHLIDCLLRLLTNSSNEDILTFTDLSLGEHSTPCCHSSQWKSSSLGVSQVVGDLEEIILLRNKVLRKDA